MQKLILQPIVENALYHGIKECDHNGTIRIDITRENGALIMTITDDGIGMTAERLAEVRAALRDCKHPKSGIYGIVNVHERLLLSYGEPYGLLLESTYGAGTVCTIRHPILEGSENVSGVDSR